MCERPDSWKDYFLGIALVISKKSKDPDTQHGAVITDRCNHIISTGYNNPARGLVDGYLPKTRPEKYPWMIHAEQNAISNMTVNPWQIPGGPILYITGKPCFKCLQLVWNTNIGEIYYGNEYGWKLDDSERVNWDKFVSMTNICVSLYKPNFNWLKDIV